MLKNMFSAAGTLGLILLLVFGRDVASYITTSADRVGDSVREHIPVEFELERAKGMITDISPQIRQTMYSIALEEVEVEQLVAQIDRLREQQDADKTMLSNIKNNLDDGSDELRIGATMYTSTEAAKVAEAKFKRYRTHDAALLSLTNILDVRRRALDASRKNFDAMIQAKQQLTAEVVSLEARQRLMDIARTSKEFDRDDSHLARTRRLLQDIEMRINVEERLMTTELRRAEEHFVPREEPANESGHVAHRIAEFFETSTSLKEAALETSH